MLYIVTVSSAQPEGYTTRNVSELPSVNLTGNPINLAILAPGTTTQSGGVVGEGRSIGGNRPRMNNFKELQNQATNFTNFTNAPENKIS